MEPGRSGKERIAVMSLHTTLQGDRIQIALFGKRNLHFFGRKPPHRLQVFFFNRINIYHNMVVPVDSAAPKGRLIMPQQQVIRDILDNQAIAIVVQVPQLPKALEDFQDRIKMARYHFS